MELKYVYFILFALSIVFLCAQLLVTKKTAVHIVFAIFSGSMAMVAVKQIGADALYPYHYLIGMGTCATCNAFWLVSRGLFRDKNAIETRHIVVAISIAGLIILSQMLQMASAFSDQVVPSRELLANAVSTLTGFLSSTILTLTFWEAFRGYSRSSGAAKHQRTLFLLAFGSAVFSCMFVAKVFLSEAQFDQLFPWFTAIAAIVILSTTQFILIWQQAERKAIIDTTTTFKPSRNIEELNDDSVRLINGIRKFVEHEKGFLQCHLKMKDIAAHLDVSEYLISRTIRLYFQSENFNQYINELRIKHAKSLLRNTANNHWTVLVIGLESGFSSLVSFNRVFKSSCACTPSEYRQRQSDNPQGNIALATHSS